MAKKLSFLEVVCVALLVNVIHWHVTSSFTVGPQSSFGTEEITTAAAAVEPTTPGPFEETTTKGCIGIECPSGIECVPDDDNRPTCPVECVGYPCPADKYCVLNEATKQPECVCNDVCYLLIDPVCGSDDQTHDNKCFLRVAACKTNKVITIQRQGRCEGGTPPTPTGTPETPETTTTASSYPTPPSDPTATTVPSSTAAIQTTVTEETRTTWKGCIGFECPVNEECVPDDDNNPTCNCILACSKIYSPVCGSDLRTHRNECELRRAACQANTTITVLRTGYCETVYIGSWYPIDKVCIGFECPVDKVCVRDADNSPTCTCILICYEVYRPVCGSDYQTYDNDCFMQRAACQANTSVTILYTGRCTGPTPSTWITGPPDYPPPTTTPETPETATTTGPPDYPPPTSTPETLETPTTSEATVTTPSAQSTTKHRRSKCRRRKHGRRYKNKGVQHLRSLKIFVDL